MLRFCGQYQYLQVCLNGHLLFSVCFVFTKCYCILSLSLKFWLIALLALMGGYCSQIVLMGKSFYFCSLKVAQ